jgi:nucleoside-diphosphate-sugar epimerase
MIYGKGFIAKAFKKYKKNNSFIFFASGVSNSLEIKSHRYNKEINLLNKVISYKNLSRTIIYFSTCSVYDPAKKNSLYVKHKLKIEKIIKKNCKNYFIFRLPNVIGDRHNRHTLVNSFLLKLKNNKKIEILSGVNRNLIDIKDVVKIVDNILKYEKKAKIINIANFYSNKVLDIVLYLGRIYSIKPNLQKKKNPARFNYKININDIKKYITLSKIKFSKSYYKKVLNKYYEK